MTLKPRVEQPLGGASVGHSVANISRALHGIEFPTTKEQMLAQAKHNHAPKEALEEIEGLADTEYTDIDQVMKRYGKQ